ncbi:MAG: S9 family peptidase [Pseudanabaena sp. RU_4_16]|nr:S9 family peptidase [Pseudanabaena sp. RU_4_16]
MKLYRCLVLVVALSIAYGTCSQKVIAAPQSYTGLGKSSIDAATLKKYAPTSLPETATRQIESMLDVRSPGLGIISPDGKQLFFSWGITGVVQIWRIDGAQKFPVQVTGGQDATTIEGISPNGKYLVLSRDRQGEENPGLYVQSTSGGPLQVIQHQAGVQTDFSFISDDSRSIYFIANDIKPDSYAIYRYDFETKQKKLIFSEAGFWGIADALPTGKLLLVKVTGSLSREYYAFDESSKQLTPLLGQGEREEYEVKFGATPDELIVLTPKFGEFRRLYRYMNGKFNAVTPEMPMDVSGFEIDYPRQRIVYSLNDRGYRRIKAMDARTFRPIVLPQFEGADNVFAGKISRDGRYMTIGVETGKTPRTSYVYDWSSNKLTQWVLPSIPEVDASQFIGASLQSYPARDGTKIPMFVWRSPKCQQQSCPVVVHFHGGPEAQSTAGFNKIAQMFVNAGFVYVEPNVRGSDGYGKTWLNADNGAKRLQVVTDIEDCALYIRKAWQVNSKVPKIGVMGWSYGGYSALMGMTKFAGSYDAGVSLVGMSNLLSFLQNTAPARRQLRITEYGDPQRDRDALIALSPITYIDRLQAPLLIIQGANDPRVPVGEAVQIQNALEKRQIPSRLIVFADEGHGSAKRSNQVLEIGHTIDFFRQHLQGGGVKTSRKESKM